MFRRDLWTEKIILENHQNLYNTGRRILKKYHEGIELLPDDIQEVYSIMWMKKKELIEHPNISGWLVETLKNVISNRMRGVFKDKQNQSFSLDDEEKVRKRKDLEVAADQSKNTEATMDKLDRIRERLGKKNTDLLLKYYGQNIPPAKLAEKMHMTEGALRVKITRLKKKLK